MKTGVSGLSKVKWFSVRAASYMRWKCGRGKGECISCVCTHFLFPYMLMHYLTYFSILLLHLRTTSLFTASNGYGELIAVLFICASLLEKKICIRNLYSLFYTVKKMFSEPWCWLGFLRGNLMPATVWNCVSSFPIVKGIVFMVFKNYLISAIVIPFLSKLEQILPIILWVW